MEPISTLALGKAISGFFLSYIGGKSIDSLGSRLKNFALPKREIKKAITRSISDTISTYPTVEHCFEDVAFQETVAHQVGNSFIPDREPDYELVASHIYELSPKSRDDSTDAAQYLLRKIEGHLADVPAFRPDIALQISNRNSNELAALRDAVEKSDKEIEGMGAELKELKVLLRPSVSLESTTVKARKCAADSARAWLRRRSILSDCFVDISLKQESDSYALAEIPLLLDSALDVVLVGAPGAGKTIALVHLVEKILDQNDELVPILLSYPEFVSAGCGILEFVSTRSGYASLSKDEIQLLGSQKRLVFLIDGWNEVNGRDGQAGGSALSAILSQFDGNGFVFSTRASAEPPGLTDSMMLTVAPITAAQRTEIINRTVGPASGVEAYIYDHPELDRITRNPFFLSCLVSSGEAALTATTKEGVMSGVVGGYEDAPQHKQALFATPMRSNHRAYLASLAFEMMDEGSVLFSRIQAYKCIQNVSQRLVDEDILQNRPEPQDILDVLIGHHLLVLEGDNVGFVHQLIQEWLASHRVQEEYQAAFSSGVELFESGRVRYVDTPFWEETLLFVTERLSQREEHDLSLLAQLVKDSLLVDPRFTAEIVYRGGDRLWPQVRTEFLATVTGWHEKGKVDRAFSAMIATGKGEFADTIWPFLENEDSQVHLKAYRASDPFRIGCLGEGWRQRFDLMPEALRKTFVYEVLQDGNAEGHFIAKNIGLSDPSMKVRVAAAVGLSWCGQEHAVEQILEEAPSEFWPVYADHHNALDTVTSTYQEKLCGEIVENVEKLSGEKKYSALLRLDSVGCGNVADMIINEVVSGTLDYKAKNSVEIINRALLLEPQRVQRVIAEHVLEGGTIPSGINYEVTEVPQDKLLELVELSISSESKSYEWAFVVGAWLPEAEVSHLLRRYLEHYEKHWADGARPEEAERQVHWGLERLLLNTNLDHLCAATIDSSWNQNETTIGLVSSLLNRNGREEKYRGGRFVLPDVTLTSLQTRVEEWIAVVLEGNRDPDCLNSLTKFLGRIGAKGALDQIIALLDIKIARYTVNRQKISEWCSRPRGGRCPYSRMCYFNQYQDVLTSLGDPSVPERLFKYLHEPHFAVEAIVVLAHYARLQDGHELPAMRYADFSKVHEERSKSVPGKALRDAHPYVEITLKCLDEINGEELVDGFSSNLISKMACRLVYMDYGSYGDAILKHISDDFLGRQRDGAFLCMTLKGDIIPFELMKPAFDDAHSYCSKNYPYRTDQWYPVFDWLKLMLFSDEPGKIFDCLESLPDMLLGTREMGSFYRAVGHCGHPVAVSILTEVELEKFKSESIQIDWVEALACSGFDETLAILIEILEGRYKGLNARSYGIRKRLAASVANVTKDDSEFANTILRIAEGSLVGCDKELLANVYLEMGTDEALQSCLLLLDDREIDRIPMSLRDFVSAKTVKNIPHGSSGWYTVEPLLSNEVRLHLLRMSHFDEKRKVCARLLLSQIDIRRDGLGRPPGENRHPDSYSGLDWPILN